jgi:hypothetical protein
MSIGAGATLLSVVCDEARNYRVTQQCDAIPPAASKADCVGNAEERETSPGNVAVSLIRSLFRSRHFPAQPLSLSCSPRNRNNSIWDRFESTLT